MALDRNECVMTMVEGALREDADISNKELSKRAAEIDPRIGQLSARSFNARYPLQVKQIVATEEEARAEGGDDLRSARP